MASNHTSEGEKAESSGSNSSSGSQDGPPLQRGGSLTGEVPAESSTAMPQRPRLAREASNSPEAVWKKLLFRREGGTKSSHSAEKEASAHQPTTKAASTRPADEEENLEHNQRRSSAASQFTQGLGRRASKVLSHVVHAIDPLHNPDIISDIGINEIRRVRSASYTPSDGFDARRYSHGAPLPAAEPAFGSKKPSFVLPGLSEKEDDYLITRMAKHDDIEFMSKWQRWVYRLGAPMTVLMVALYFCYFAMRILFTRKAEIAFNKTYWMAWMFIVVEILVLLPTMLHRLWGLHVLGVRHRPKLRIIGNNVPSIDVIITCCGEDDDMVLDTAKAACNVDYPRSRFRVIICDDGQSNNLKEMAERAALEYELFDNLYYRSRPKYPGVPHHFKAGNLNYALEETKKLRGGAANFFAALDADMIPERDWLRALIPHMIKDERCSMTCPPQLFYNIPDDDPLCQSLDVFVHAAEPLKDTLGAAWCTGSGYVMRRKALDSIGGFPIGSLAEDVCTSSMLLGVGWNTVFVHEALQYGTVPDSLSSHLKQRTRWTIGTVQTSLKLRFCLYGPLVRDMTFQQRLCGLVYTVDALFKIALVMSMLVAPVVLISGGTLIPFSTYSQLRWLIRNWFALHILNRINELIIYIPSGYQAGHRGARAILWMAVFQSICIVRTFLLPSWLGGKVAVFTSSGSQKAELNERTELRAPLWRRLKATLWDYQCYLHLLYIIFVIIAVALSTFWSIRNHRNQVKQTLIALLTRAGWPPFMWWTCAVSCAVPIIYAIAPPRCPPREELLERDPATGVAYPTKDARNVKNTWRSWIHEVEYSFLTVYTIGLLVACHWI